MQAVILFSKQFLFLSLGHFDPKCILSFIIKINNIRGDLNDVSATTKTLNASGALVASPSIRQPKSLSFVL